MPELFAGLDDVLPALDVQLEETWSGEEGPATEVLITANIEQALSGLAAHFLGRPQSRRQRNWPAFSDTVVQSRWVSKGTPQGDWVDSFARFLLTLRDRMQKAKQSELPDKEQATTVPSCASPRAAAKKRAEAVRAHRHASGQKRLPNMLAQSRMTAKLSCVSARTVFPAHPKHQPAIEGHQHGVHFSSSALSAAWPSHRCAVWPSPPQLCIPRP